jgi:predicted transcriptional regulator
MPTSVHIPKPLLAAVDRRARALRISRNRLIIQALEHEVEERGWSPGFFAKLRELEPGAADALRETMAAVQAARRSKAPPRL